MIDPCQVEGDQRISDHITDQYSARMKSLANELLTGKSKLTLDDWHARMQDAIRLAYLHQAIAGTPDQDERLITSKDMARIESNIQEQYQYLDGFVDDIIAAVEKDGASLDFIPNRAAMYARSSQSEYWTQAIQVDLPAMPRDGSTKCLSNCQCDWSLDCDDKGNVMATWNLGEADHCPDCEQRSKEWNPLVIPA